MTPAGRALRHDNVMIPTLGDSERITSVLGGRGIPPGPVIVRSFSHHAKAAETSDIATNTMPVNSTRTSMFFTIYSPEKILTCDESAINTHE